MISIMNFLKLKDEDSRRFLGFFSQSRVVSTNWTVCAQIFVDIFTRGCKKSSNEQFVFEAQDVWTKFANHLLVTQFLWDKTQNDLFLRKSKFNFLWMWCTPFYFKNSNFCLKDCRLKKEFFFWKFFTTCTNINEFLTVQTAKHKSCRGACAYL